MEMLNRQLSLFAVEVAEYAYPQDKVWNTLCVNGEPTTARKLAKALEVLDSKFAAAASQLEGYLKERGKGVPKRLHNLEDIFTTLMFANILG